MRQKIKQICKERRISINQMEKDLEFARGYISKLDKSKPSIDNALKIANYLGVEVKDLV